MEWLPISTRCPHEDCGSHLISKMEDEFMDDMIRELWQCDECSGYWSEVHRLESVRLLHSDDDVSDWWAHAN